MNVFVIGTLSLAVGAVGGFYFGVNPKRASLAKTAKALHERAENKGFDTAHLTMEDSFGKKGVTVVLSVYNQTVPDHVKLAKLVGDNLVKDLSIENEDWEESK